MGDLNHCLRSGTVFFIAASKGPYFSELSVSVFKYTNQNGFEYGESQQEFSGLSILLVLLVIFGIEQGLLYIRNLSDKDIEPCFEIDFLDVSEDVDNKNAVKEDGAVLESICVEEVKVHNDKKQIVELLSPKNKLFDGLLEKICREIKSNPPTRCDDGTSGVYFFKNSIGEKIAVFKPADEEGMFIEDREGDEIKPGCSSGTGYLKEAATYILDRDGFYGVPRTTVVSCQESLYGLSGSSHKLGSLQEFVPSKCAAEDLGSSKFQTKDIHKIGLLDCRILNLDRHLGNLLVTEKNGKHSLVPIDHGLSFPSYISGSALFEWLQFPQCKQPFGEDIVNHVCDIDVDNDAIILRQQLPDLKEECIDTMKMCTIFLKKAVARGKTLFEIGTMMSRYTSAGEEKSKLEEIDTVVRQRVLEENANFWTVLDEEIDRVLTL